MINIGAGEVAGKNDIIKDNEVADIPADRLGKVEVGVQGVIGGKVPKDSGGIDAYLGGNP
ncbi:MAG: hypothetical protein ABFR97_03730 [Thermodesulfobacteriota bacterium]